MEPRTLQYMAAAAHGQQLSGSPGALVQRVCTDSREVRPDDLFVALAGERFDGHTFLTQAAARGVAGALIDRAKTPARLPACGIIAVDNTRAAFGRMAARYRQDFSIPLIAVAGSNGKTTTKELVAAVLRQRFRTLSSLASFNNDVGVPTTLLQLDNSHEVAVLEFGTNHPGELAPLLRLAQPRFGILTSIGREHLEFFHDLDGVIQEEGTLAECLPKDGKLFLPGEAPGFAQISARAVAPTVRIGFGPDNDWRAREVRMDGTGLSFRVDTAAPGFTREFRLKLLGRHQVANALFAIALGAEFGLTPEQVQAGLLECAPAKMRLQLWTWHGVQWLDDSYNANADSMRAALETLRDFPAQGRRVAVLGNMAELGLHAAAAHAEVGRYAGVLGLDHLLAVGSMASQTAGAAREAGLSAVDECSEVSEAAAKLEELLRPGDVVLLKASRSSALERVGQLLKEKRGAGNDPGPVPTRPPPPPSCS